MKNFIENIHITNFKSIKDCKIENCWRMNLFIGRPNVGKTDIIDMLSKKHILDVINFSFKGFF